MTKSSPTAHSVSAVFVLYFPDVALLESNVERLSRSVEHILLVDNSADATVQEQLQPVLQRASVSYLDMGDNLGIASALNRGIEFARERGSTWLLTLDQDSVPGETMVDDLLACYDSLTPEEQQQVTQLCPAIIDEDTKIPKRERPADGRAWMDVYVAITSGSLHRVDSFDAIGVFDDELFIYHVDTEFSLRSYFKRFRTLLVFDAVLLHSDGSQEVVSKWGFSFVVTNHSPVARYYMFRNAVLLFRRELMFQPRFTYHLLRWHTKTLLKVMFLEEQRASKLKMIARGLWHGLLGKDGRYDG